MQVQIHAPWSVNEHLDETIKEKINKLTTYYSRIERVDVYLKMGDSNMQDAKVVKIRVAVPKNDLFAEGHSDSFEKAIADVTEKLYKQLIKHKDKLSNH